MGMTIDNHIEILKSCQYGFGFTGYAGNLQDSIDVAVDIMEKYQKIKEIHKEYANTQYEYIGMQKMGEVLEDGNDD